MREYNADVHALNALMAQGKISTVEYDTELERLNRQVGAMHGPISQIAEREAAALQRIRAAELSDLTAGPLEFFAPARRLYAKFGFTPCPPFGGYEPSEHNTFMTLPVA